MAVASRRKTVWVWVIVLAVFAGAAWVAISTIRSSLQPLGVIEDPFPDEDARPQGSDASRGPVNFLVFGHTESSNQTLSIFHLADGRRRIDVMNFAANSPLVENIDDVEATVSAVEDLTDARMEHVMVWDLAFLAELDDADVSAEQIVASPPALSGEYVWSTVLQGALDTSDPAQLQDIASRLTPYVAADRSLNTGRITDLARSLRHVPADNISSCTLPADLTDEQRAEVVQYFASGSPARCAELLSQR